MQQIYGKLTDGKDGRCALGVLGIGEANFLEWSTLFRRYEISAVDVSCPECGDVRFTEVNLISHLNDKHQFDFLTIARKM